MYHTITPLHVAASFDLVTVERQLIDQGSSVHARDSLGWTPLHRASGSSSGPPGEQRGSDMVAKLLLEHGAEPSALGNYNTTPLHRAAQGRRLEVARILLRDRRVDVSCTDAVNATPLHDAVLLEDEEMVKLLRSWTTDGAKTWIRDEQGFSTASRLASSICRIRGDCNTAVAEEHSHRHTRQ